SPNPPDLHSSPAKISTFRSHTSPPPPARTASASHSFHPSARTPPAHAPPSPETHPSPVAPPTLPPPAPDSPVPAHCRRSAARTTPPLSTVPATASAHGQRCLPPPPQDRHGSSHPRAPTPWAR